ncbi:hypothetical protein ACU4GR_27250 [Methylobacterium oryzae CBMB20]
MRDDFRRILTQANRANGGATLDTIEGTLAALTEDRAETAAQHLATLAFRYQGEGSFDLAARAYGLAAQISRARAARCMSWPPSGQASSIAAGGRPSTGWRIS